MRDKNNRLLAIFYVLANLTFITMIIFQWNELKELHDVLLNYSEYRRKEYLGVNKFIAQSLFYLIGLGLSLFAVMDFLKGRIQKRKSVLMFGIYFLVFILLELPLYDKHIGWENQHGHSYWNGFHFH